MINKSRENNTNSIKIHIDCLLTIKILLRHANLGYAAAPLCRYKQATSNSRAVLELKAFSIYLS